MSVVRTVEDACPYDNVKLCLSVCASNFVLFHVLMCGSTKALPYRKDLDLHLNFLIYLVLT